MKYRTAPMQNHFALYVMRNATKLFHAKELYFYSHRSYKYVKRKKHYRILRMHEISYDFSPAPLLYRIARKILYVARNVQAPSCAL